MAVLLRNHNYDLYMLTMDNGKLFLLKVSEALEQFQKSKISIFWKKSIIEN